MSFMEAAWMLGASEPARRDRVAWVVDWNVSRHARKARSMMPMRLHRLPSLFRLLRCAALVSAGAFGVAGTAGAGEVAAQLSPVGTWHALDDSGKVEKAEIRIEESAGVLTGRLVRLLDGRSAQSLRCEHCEDDRKGLPLAGLEILRDLRQDPQHAEVWSGGQVLDPSSGKVYRALLTLTDEGRRLRVRGYFGTPAFGRTQLWERAD